MVATTVSNEEAEVIQIMERYREKYGLKVDMFLGETFQEIARSGDTGMMAAFFMHLVNSCASIEKSMMRVGIVENAVVN